MSAELLNQSVGKVNYLPDEAKYLGMTALIEDSEPGTGGSQQRLLNSGMLINARLVRFGGVYKPGSAVKWTSGYAGSRVEQANSEPAVGVVDPFLAADTASGDVGLIFTDGPMDVLTGAAYSANDNLVVGAGGKFIEGSAGGAVGVAIEAATAADQNKRALMSFSSIGAAESDDGWEFMDDFFGAGTLTASPAGNDLWDIADTSVAGTPTYVYVDGSPNGEVALDFDSQAEAQNVCLFQSDKLQFDIDKIQYAEFRVKMNQATADAATSFAIGLTGDRNDAIDSIAQAALFRVVGADSTTALVVESDDGTNDNDDVATGETLINAYKVLRIDFTAGTDDVRFYVDGTRVASGTTFDMSNYTGALQMFAQIQKTSDANTDGFTLDYVKAVGVR